MKEKGLVSNSQSILRKLKVYEIKDIELKRKLNRQEVIQKTSACIINNRSGLMLLIINNYDYFGNYIYLFIYLFIYFLYNI